jgi:tetratricopeptide (TPR) repeat protein
MANETDEQLSERDYQLATGQINLAEYAGIDKRQLYVIANQGYQLLESGRIEEAKDIYQGLVAADPSDSVFHCHLGSIFVRLGKTDEAFDEFNLALDYNIANVDAFVGRGEIQLSRGKVQDAIDDFRKAIEYDSEAKRGSTVRARAILLALKDAIEKETSNDSKTQTAT